MGDYLLEVGCDEIPARMIAEAARTLGETLAGRLAEEGLAPQGAPEELAGPRRLAVIVRGIPPRQADRSERIVGPPADKAFDSGGRPTRAGIAFAARLGIDPGALERVETPKGEAVAGTREIKGEGAAAVLARIVPGIVLGQSFPKTMRWGSGAQRYVRAIRSVVSLLDGEVVPFVLAGVAAGRTSFGHRFLGRPRVDIADPSRYASTLLAEHVVAAAVRRKEILAARLRELAAAAGGIPDEDDRLLEEVTYLVEEPHAVSGRYSEQDLALPAEVLVTAMKHHQKAFPVWQDAARTRLVPAFVAVANVPDVEGHIARGFERVLAARLDDARFFWVEDRKVPLAARAARLERVVFHDRLGSYAAKAARLAELAPLAAFELGHDALVAARAGEAARLAKCDLTTGMVGEFAELQGVMGGLYLAAEGADPAVARAVYEHYRPLSMEDPLPASPTGQALSLADKLDTLVGCFGAGLIPSGTKDPFGLRRAAQGAVRVALAAAGAPDLARLAAAAADLHTRIPGAREANGSLATLTAWLTERVEFVLARGGHRPDTLAAVLAVAPLAVRSAEARARALSQLRSEPAFEQAFTVFKRAGNIAGTSGSTAFDPARFGDETERRLAAAYREVQGAVAGHLAASDFRAALGAVSGLAATLHEFFERVLVMDPDPAVRDNRLALLRAIGALVAPIGDFTRLQVEAGKPQP